VKFRQNLDSLVNRTCHQCCMVYRLCSMVHSTRVWRCRRVKGIRIQGLYNQVPLWSLRIVCVETQNPAGLARSSRKEVAVKNFAWLAWTTKNRSWAGAVSLCWRPACLLVGVLCSRYISQALVITVWCIPNAAPTLRKVAPCYTIPTALHNSQMPPYVSICHIEVTDVRNVSQWMTKCR
jgi:hypothetical protein